MYEKYLNARGERDRGLLLLNLLRLEPLLRLVELCERPAQWCVPPRQRDASVREEALGLRHVVEGVGGVAADGQDERRARGVAGVVAVLEWRDGVPSLTPIR